LLTGLSNLLWLTSDGQHERLVLFAVSFGLGYGGWIALSPTVASGLFGTAGLGRLLGALYTSGAIAGLLGPPLAGLLIDLTHSYTVVMLTCVLLAFGAWAALARLAAPATNSEPLVAPNRPSTVLSSALRGAWR
jgi:MFS family permease